MQKLLFLDRDGVINKDIGYLSQISDIIFLDGIHELIEKALNNKFKIVIITNQSGIGRKYFTEKQFHQIMNHMINDLVEAIKSLKIDDISYYFCPHVPEDKCSCRKPLTGLFHTCQENFAIDVDWQNCIMVGDKITDIIASENMGVINNYLLVSEQNCDADHRMSDISCDFNKILHLSEVKVS